ncbi:MAG TPA: cupredoxin domain-containing protein [Actinomycetota bacterium]|nr:cupredoxin domain-containing protein [Actinomycetota bacterium]
MKRPLLSLLCLALVVPLATACASNPKPSGSGGSPTPSLSPPIPVTGTVVDRANVDDTAKGSSLSVEIAAGDDYFSPTYIKAAPGAHVAITVDDVGKNPHTFTIASAGINLQLSPGQSQSTQVTLPMTGSLPFYCSYHQLLGMRGAFYVS